MKTFPQRPQRREMIFRPKIPIGSCWLSNHQMMSSVFWIAPSMPLKKTLHGKHGNSKICFTAAPNHPENSIYLPGQGSQYVNMGRDLVCFFPDAMNVMEGANKTFESTGCLTDHIYPISSQNEKDRHLQEETLRKTDIAQPAIGAISMAMLKILQHFGLRPDAVCGHSFGELSALCAAGRIDLESFLSLAIIRGRLMAKSGENNDQNNGAWWPLKPPWTNSKSSSKTQQPMLFWPTGTVPHRAFCPDRWTLWPELKKNARKKDSEPFGFRSPLRFTALLFNTPKTFFPGHRKHQHLAV